MKEDTTMSLSVTLHLVLYFCGGTLTTNRRLLTVSVVCPLGTVNQHFMLDRTAWSSAMYFSVSFVGSIVAISINRSTHFRLDVLASLGLLQYRCVLLYEGEHIEDGL